MSHAKLSPSSAHRWMNCPGSAALCVDVPRVDTIYTKEGTFAHHWAAQCLLDDKDAKEVIGRTIALPEGGITEGEFTVTEEMAEHIQVYLDAVRGDLMLDGGELLVETKARVSENVYGTADAIIVARHVVHVYDLKFGSGKLVSADANEQLMIYGLGAVKDMPLPPETPVRLHIVQPRCEFADMPWRTSETTIGWLRTMWAERVAKAEYKAMEPNASLNPGDWCGFCPAKVFCPSLRKQALTAAQSIFKNLDLVEAPVKPPSPANLTPQQIAVALAGEDLVTAWFKGVNEMAVSLAKQGKLPGYKMVAKVGLRKWVDDAQAADALRLARIDPMAEPKIVSPAQAEKLLAKTALGKKGGERLVEKLAHKPVTGETLVPDSDPRPALGAGHPFTPLD